MKSKIIKGLKWALLTIGVLISIVSIIGVSFLYLSPQFGGSVSDAQKVEYAKTGHYANDIFINKEPINMQMDCHSLQAMIDETLNPHPHVVPLNDLHVNPLAADQVNHVNDSTTQLTWLGHSSFLIELSGKQLLLDPVFGQYAAPHPWLGRKRFNSQMPITIAELPSIDAVIISHDHYDHLDYPTIKQLKDKVQHFYVPLGVGNHLRRWKVPEDKIHEMDWWQSNNLDELNITFAPSRHMSGRALTDQSATLWGSWIFTSPKHKIFFSGDGGYGKHFAEIGAKYGPFDVGLMECGQYNPLWKDVHLSPEQTVQASQDVQAQVAIPIHWGAFTLAPHSWTDPVERFTAEAQRQGLRYATPEVGQPIVLNNKRWPQKRWWEAVD